jgi:hypothetical protein
VREPVFNETLQLGVVVRDLEATMRRYVDDYGVGPWQVYEFDAGRAEDFREYGQPVERSWRLAVATVGQVRHRCGRSPAAGRERPLTPGWVHAQAAEPGSAMTRMPRPTSVFRTTSEN